MKKATRHKNIIRAWQQPMTQDDIHINYTHILELGTKMTTWIIIHRCLHVCRDAQLQAMVHIKPAGDDSNYFNYLYDKKWNSSWVATASFSVVILETGFISEERRYRAF